MPLPTLQKDSGKSLPSWLFSRTGQRNKLMVTGSSSGWGVTYVPAKTINLNDASTIYSVRKVTKFDKPSQNNFAGMVNKQLSGGDSYPVLEFALGTAVGAVSGGAGLVFSVACLGLSLSKTSYGVMVRGEDELWQVEQIGLVGKETYHVSAYFLYDPNRNKTFKGGNGWLIHEERNKLTV